MNHQYDDQVIDNMLNNLGQMETPNEFVFVPYSRKRVHFDCRYTTLALARMVSVFFRLIRRGDRKMKMKI